MGDPPWGGFAGRGRGEDVWVAHEVGATVDELQRAGDERRLVRDQERDQGRDLYGLRPPSERRVVRELVDESGHRPQQVGQLGLDQPGATALTRMPVAPSSSAATSVSIFTPPFAAQYVAIPRAAWTALRLAVATTDPPPPAAPPRPSCLPHTP